MVEKADAGLQVAGSQVLALADVAIARPPAVVLEEARKAAVLLKDVVDKKPKPVMMNGERYLEYEDWQTVGRFYGITAKVTSTAFVEYGSIKGFTAHAVALRADGLEISAAEADCLNDEEKWSTRSKYEWQGEPGRREKVKVGEENVPLFQMKSMAQTRACAKALRNVLAWVVVLAGYRPTPAEELERSDGQPEEQAAPKAAGSGQSAGAAAAPAGATKVKDTKTKTGQNARGPWTLYTVRFEDGRMGTTFSESIYKHAEEAKVAGALVVPIIEKTDKGSNLTGFEEAKKKEAPAAHHAPEHNDAPVTGPEKVLTVRKVTTDKGERFIIQTDKRELHSDKPDLANEALRARKAGAGVLPKFEVILHEGRKYNKLLNLIVGAEPELAEAPTKGAKKPKAKKGREPGEEG